MHPLYRQVATLMETVAAEIVLPRYQNLAAEEIEEKAADDYVTIADKESEIRLHEGLSKILPEAGVVGEEAVAADPTVMDNVGNGLQWIIDPIDGTGNFAAGRAPFGIMVGLVDNGVIQAGWILDPLTGRMCHAALGGGAYIDEERIAAKETGADKPIAALAVYFLTVEQRAEIAVKAEGKLTLVDIPRCAAEQYPRLVLGTNDVSLFERSHPWDHAAGALLLNESGAKLARRDGTPYIIGDNKRGLLGASSHRMWDKAAQILC
ncbi:inositol monophosphatase [soil metagenome]|uniref:inositol monophosphatase family protein n=1 Tax=Sphingobium sp. CECT 9361 TaxID=2845384 RepID=UPI001E63285C|nr:inositol monophosphatase family protein [Sphingobium sp. CECT 9361]CAH0352304.1 Fructose-1, 6-bisphosphatase/inositol-1-monophosphatase [Sphingobium sp. CECT 9361]